MAVDPNMDKAGLAADGLASELNKVASEAKKFATTMNAMSEKLKKAANLTEEELSEASKKVKGMATEADKSKGLFVILNRNAVVFGSNFNSLAASVNKFRLRVDNTLKNDQIRRFNSIFLGVGQTFTDFRNTIYGLQKEVNTTFRTAISVGIDAFTNRITSFFSLTGPTLSFQESIDAINAFQQEFGGILTRGEAQKIAQASKDLGVSASVFLKAQRSFLVAGADATKQTFITTFRDAGLTAADALKFAAQNANLVAIAGNKYAGALAQAAANSQRIGVGLDRTEALADGIVGNFEGALERFSELRAMGVEVDFNKLAAVAGTGTTQEVVSELQSQLGNNQRLLSELQRNRFLKVALEQDLGLNIAEITRLAAGEQAKATEETQAEKQSGLGSRVLERVGTILSGIGLLNLSIGTNTVATVGNTKAMLGGGFFRSLFGLGPKTPPPLPPSTPPRPALTATSSATTARVMYAPAAGGPVTPGRQGQVPGQYPPVSTGGVTNLGSGQKLLTSGGATGGATGGRAVGGTTMGTAQTPQELRRQLDRRLAETTSLASNIKSQQGISGFAAGQAALRAQANQPGTVALAAQLRQQSPGMSNIDALRMARGQATVPTQQIGSTSTQMVRATATPVAAPGGGMFGTAMAGAGGGAAVTGAGVLGGAMAGISEYQQTKSIKRAIAATLIGIVTSVLATLLIGLIPGAQLVAPIVGGMIGSQVTPMLTNVFLGSAKAAGGLITGPGTQTSDNILTPTSPGEYVVNAKATKAYGVDMLDKINKGSFAPSQAPAVNNVVNVSTDKLEAKLDKLASAMSNIRIDMDGNKVGRIALNSRSPLDHLSTV